MSGAKRKKQRGRERQMKKREKVKDAFALPEDSEMLSFSSEVKLI